MNAASRRVQEETKFFRLFGEEYKQSLLVDEEILMSRRIEYEEPDGFEDVTGELYEIEEQDEFEEEQDEFQTIWEEEAEETLLEQYQREEAELEHIIMMQYGVFGVPRFINELDEEDQIVWARMVRRRGGVAGVLTSMGYNVATVLSVTEE